MAQSSDYGHSPVTKFKSGNAPNQTPFEGGKPTGIVEIRSFRKQIAGLGCGFWIDRHVFLEVGGIAENLHINEDTEYCICLMAVGRTGSTAPHAGVMVRQHGGDDGQRGI